MHTKLQCKCLCTGKNAFMVPPHLYTISNTTSQFYYTEKTTMGLFGSVGCGLFFFFWTRGQPDKLEHTFPVYIFTYPYPGKIAVFYAFYRRLQKSSKCNKKANLVKNLKNIFKIRGWGMVKKSKEG